MISLARTSLAQPEARLSAGLVAAIVVLAAVAIWPWLPGSSRAAAVGAASPPPEAKAATVKLPTYETFTAAIERPLFSPSRRPAAGPVQGPLPAAQGPSRLIGIVVAGAHRRALIAQTGAAPIEIGEGESFEGRTVKRIEQNRVILLDVKGAETVLTLAPPPGRRPR